MSERARRRRSNASASLPFLTLGGFALFFGILASSGLYVDGLRAAAAAFDTPWFILLAAGATTFIAAAFYYHEKRRMP